MKLIRLKLENFQGIRRAEFQLDGQNASFYGDNATGKTTIFNAVTWLLFGKDSTGAKNYTPKTKGKDGEDLHYLEHTAEAEFEEGGRNVTFRKTYHEKYKKRRGSAEETFGGHEVDHFVDGVPTKEKDYQLALLALVGDAEKMKMLTMPDYFPETMAWDARRKILLEICGDVSDEEVIASVPELAALRKYLKMPGTGDQFYSVDEYKKIAQAAKTDINKQIQGIPGRIDEAERAIPNTDGLSLPLIDRELQALNAQMAELEQQKARLLAGDSATATIRQRISAAQTGLVERRAAYAERYSAANDGLLQRINQLKTDAIGETNAARDAHNESDRARRDLAQMQELRELLLQEYARIQAERWDDAAETCPSCGQRLPAKNIQELINAYNLRKSKRLEEINRQGNTEASKGMITEAEARIAAYDAQAEKHDAAAAKLEKDIEGLQAQIITPFPFEQTDEYLAAKTQIEALCDEERKAGENVAATADRITAKIQPLAASAEQLQQKKTYLQLAAGQRERIEELKHSEKALAEQYEKLEYGVYLCDLFTKAKVSLLTGQINDKFNHVRFRLFVEQLNGGVKEDCEVLVPSEDGRQLVPFPFANKAGRINAGLEIINTLSLHWGLVMPVFVDNAESVTRLLQLDTQIIRLVVSETYDKLTLIDQAGRKTQI